MRLRIVIVGDLPNRPDRSALLRELGARHAAVEWDWIQPDNEQYGLPAKYFSRLINQLRTPARDISITVVKLALLNGKDAHSLYRVYPDPVEPPSDLQTSQELIEWILLPSTGLIPKTTWSLPVREVGLLALLTKLVRNKSWNKDNQGHMWTKEVDLLGQAPVSRPGHPRVYTEATECLVRAAGTLLLTKGGKQGKTPKEWSINLAYLSLVKKAIMARSFAAFREERDLSELMAFVDRGDTAELVEIDAVILSERVLAICRDR